MSGVGKVQSGKQRRVSSPIARSMFQPVGDRGDRGSPQSHNLAARAASLSQNPQSWGIRIEVGEAELTNFGPPQSITPQQPEQSIISLLIWFKANPLFF